MLKSKLFEKIGIEHGFMLPNEEKPPGLRTVHQTHSNTAVDLSRAEPGGSTKADAVISEAPGVAVGIQTADCLPILLAGKAGHQVAAIHAGWRGLENRIIKNALSFFAKGNPVFAAIGPCIGACCFEAGRDVIEKFPQIFSLQQALSKNKKKQACARNSNLWFDLKSIARKQLIDFGLSAEMIELIDECTYCSNLGFASFRRATHESDQKNNDRAKRQFSWIKANASG